MAAPWVVNIKGEAGDKDFEISVLRDDNEHGKKSYGWFDESKLLIGHNGGPCEWPVIPLVWDGLVHLAYFVVEELNAQEACDVSKAI